MTDTTLTIELGADDAELRPFLVHHLSAFLAPSYGAPTDALVEHARRTVRAGDPLIACRRAGKLAAIGALRRQKFDSEIYGLGMAELRHVVADGPYAEARAAVERLVDEAWRIAAGAGIEHLACCIGVDDVAARHALEARGFLLMDTKVEYAWTPSLVTSDKRAFGYVVRAAAEPSEAAEAMRLVTLGSTIRPFEPADLAALQSVAAQAFTERTLTRYTVDPSLPTAKTAQLYATWVENAALGRFGDLLLVAEVEARPVGFQMLRVERDLGELVGGTIGAMGIGAIEPGSDAQGAFPALLTEILGWARAQGLRWVRGGVLVNNLRMHRSCVMTGAAVAACQHTFHAHRR